MNNPNEHPENRAPQAGQAKETNSWRFASEGTQLAVIVLVLVYVGFRFDRWKGTSPWGLLTGAVIGIIIGLTNFLKHVSKTD